MSDAGSQLRFMIVGVARSGTTLIQRLASELEEVRVPPETHFWRHAESLARQAEWPLTTETFDDLVDSFASLPGLCDFPFDREAARARVPESAWMWDVFEAVTAAGTLQPGTIIGEKTPAHHRWAHRLLTEIESLRVVGIRRDPYETFASHLDLAWGVKDPVEFAVRFRLADDELRLLEQTFPDRVLVLDHDVVARDPDEARARIAGLIGVENRIRPAPPTAGELFDPAETWKSGATRAIRPSTRNRGDLPAEQAEVIRAIVEGDIGPEMSARVAAAQANERRLAAPSCRPLPLTAADDATWKASDTGRARAWERQAERLRDERDRADRRAADWRARAETHRDDASRWRARAEEIADDHTEAAGELATAQARGDRLKSEVASLQRRRSVRFANALGRLLRPRRRH